jgi:Uma2 family endonuclease
MSQPAYSALAPLPFELVYDDGEPLESDWHVQQLGLLREGILRAMEAQGRTDFHIGTSQCVYYSPEQAREVWREENEDRKRRAFRGPDVFWVGGVPRHSRKSWVSWEEGNRLPDVIIELLSPSTAKVDRTVKKDLYARVFGTGEYFLVDPVPRTRLPGIRLT